MASAYTAFVFIQSNLNHGQKWYVKHGNKVCASCKRLYVFGSKITRIDIRSSGFVITRLVTVSPRITEKRNKNKIGLWNMLSVIVMQFTEVR